MNRKNAFSYLMWFLYMAAVCGGLMWRMGTLCVQMGVSQLIGIGCVCGWLLIVFLLNFGIHKLVKKHGNRVISGVPAAVTEVLIIMCLLTAGIVLRAFSVSTVVQESPYFEIARITAGNQIPTIVHGAVYLYIQLLHLVYWIFGNKFLAGIWLQIILQVLSAVCFYGTVRRVAGVIPAMVMYVFLMLSPLMIDSVLVLSPEFLFLCVFALGLYVCSCCMRRNRKSGVYLGAGLLIALAGYMDILGFVLLIFALAGIALKVGTTGTDEKKRMLSALFCIVGTAAGFIIWILVDSLVSGNTMGSVLQAWWKVYVPNGYLSMELPIHVSVTVEGLVLLMLMSIGIFSFWNQRKTDHISLWMLTVISILLLQCFGFTTEELDGGVLLFLMAAVLVGSGILAVIAQESVAVEDIWKDGRLEAQLIAMSQDVETSDGEGETVEGDEMRRVKLIDNPLPLPRKHVKKVLDFDIVPKEDMEDFDVSVSDDDDFDI